MPILLAPTRRLMAARFASHDIAYDYSACEPLEAITPAASNAGHQLSNTTISAGQHAIIDGR